VSADILLQSKTVTAHLQVDCMESTSDALNTISSCEVSVLLFVLPVQPSINSSLI